MGEVTEKEQSYLRNSERLAELYESVKPIFLLVEYFNEKDGIVLTSMNEIRSAFDHTMRALRCDSSQSLEDEFDKARKHLYRAAYDACEIMVLDRLDFIGRLKRGIPYDVLVRFYPEYATEILPLTLRLRREAAEIRTMADSKERLDEYCSLILKLIDYTEQLEKVLPAVKKYKKRQDMESFYSPTFVSIVFGAVLVMVSLVTFLHPGISLGWQAFTGGTTILFCMVYLLFENRKRGVDG